MTQRALVARSEVPKRDTWDLKPLFTSDAAWERAFKDLEKRLRGYAKFKGKLGRSASMLRACLEFDHATERAMDRLAVYASLKMCEDLTNSKYVAYEGRITSLASRAMEASSYISPEILALPKKRLDRYLKSKELSPHRFNLEKLVRQKPHVLSQSEERLLALSAESGQATSNIFEQLENSDLKFGKVADTDGREAELTNESFRSFLESPDPAVREKAFRQYYVQFEGHKHTLAATLAGSVHNDVFHARARNHETCLDSALFSDNVPRTVYTNLIKTVRANLPAVHRYYDLRRRALGLEEIHHYDTYVPILSDLKSRNTFEEAVALVLEALSPLGPEYLRALRKGFASRWIDRYENKGKRSGAFSSGMYDSPPYMLMNFKEDVLDDVFTLAHEAGHSMHSYLSARAQPYHMSHYTIFVAEVASTFNEQLLSEHLLSRATDDRMRAFLINREIDAIRSTLVRQTMFADFELVIHELAESGEALTIDRLRSEYRKVLQVYFGPGFALDAELELECLRIPHFYHAFYVYKYATGISAAIALATRVRSGRARDLEAYLGFLRSGGSRWPLQALKDAGVDMSRPAPIQTAMTQLETRVAELEELLRVR